MGALEGGDMGANLKSMTGLYPSMEEHFFLFWGEQVCRLGH